MGAPVEPTETNVRMFPSTWSSFLRIVRTDMTNIDLVNGVPTVANTLLYVFNSRPSPCAASGRRKNLENGAQI